MLNIFRKFCRVFEVLSSFFDCDMKDIMSLFSNLPDKFNSILSQSINPSLLKENEKTVLHELNIMCKAKLYHKHHKYSKNRRKLRKNNLTTMSAFFNIINLSKFVYNIQDFL